ncbi:hypothetical protein [Anoxynatronum sibiricum]|uniref:Uncharacterized protein n=1 Tax=Anoxynatronum sibiricum TaxID=210623 RepID=A0ABU9VWT2_9CLOT
MSNARLKRLEKALMSTGFKAIITSHDETGALIDWHTGQPVTADDLKRADLHISVLWE